MAPFFIYSKDSNIYILIFKYYRYILPGIPILFVIRIRDKGVKDVLEKDKHNYKEHRYRL